jgi:hypothetical protein
VARRLLVVVAWVVATLVASAVAWGAVAKIGSDSTASTNVLSRTEVHTVLVHRTPSVPSPTTATAPGATLSTKPSTHRGRSRSHGDHRGSGQSTASTSGPTSSPGGSASSGPTTGPSSGPTPPSGGPGHHPGGGSGATSAPPAEHSRSWSLRGGNVGATCQGTVIHLDYAYAKDGWQYDPVSTGPTTLEVQFERTSAESRLTAHCSNGRPVGTINNDDGGTDDSGGGGE